MPRWPFLWRTTPELVDPQLAYALWAPSYPPKPHNRLMEIEQATVLSLLPDVRGRIALDAGCGSGRYLRELSLRGARAFGLDRSDAMLARASAEGAPLMRANLAALPIASRAVDVAVCGLALDDVADLALALAELARVLRPDGCLIYSVVHPAGRRAGWSRTFDAAGRVRAIETHWHSVDDHRRACDAAGLAVTAWEEPVLEEVPRCPAVLVVRVTSGKGRQEIRSSGDQEGARGARSALRADAAGRTRKMSRRAIGERLILSRPPVRVRAGRRPAARAPRQPSDLLISCLSCLRGVASLWQDPRCY